MKLLTIKSDTGHHSQFLQCLFQNSNMFKQFDSVDPECDHHWEEKVSKKLFKLSDNLFIWLLFFKIRKAWKIFDKNGDGKISKQEFRSWWSLMNHTFDHSIQNSFNWRILKTMLWLIVNCEHVFLQWYSLPFMLKVDDQPRKTFQKTNQLCFSTLWHGRGRNA